MRENEESIKAQQEVLKKSWITEVVPMEKLSTMRCKICGDDYHPPCTDQTNCLNMPVRSNEDVIKRIKKICDTYSKYTDAESAILEIRSELL